MDTITTPAELFWIHAEKTDLGGHTSFDLDFATLAEAIEIAEQIVEDRDADRVTLSARYRRLDATYDRDGWDGEDAAEMMRCEICGESAGEGGALCPACAKSR